MKVTVVSYLHCENDEPIVLAVIKGTSEAKAKKAAITGLDNDNPTRIIAEYGDLVLQERFEDDDYSDGFTPWESSGTLYLTTHNVQ